MNRIEERIGVVTLMTIVLIAAGMTMSMPRASASSNMSILPLDRATGINDVGMVVGLVGERIARWKPGDVNALPVAGPYHPWMFISGNMVSTPPPTIDNSGAIAGTVLNNGQWKEGAPESTAFYWPGSGDVVAFSTGGYYSSAVDINNEGQVAGTSSDPWGYSRPFIYSVPDEDHPGGLIRVLPQQDDYSSETYVCGLNDHGQVLGSDPGIVLWLWEDGEMTNINVGSNWGAAIPPCHEPVHMLNSKGEVVHRIIMWDEDPSQYQILWSVYSYPTGWHTLPTDSEHADAEAINDAGQVLGTNWVEDASPPGWLGEIVIWNKTSADTWGMMGHLGRPNGAYDCENGYLNDQGAFAVACYGFFGYDDRGETTRTFLWTPAGGWSDPLPTGYPTGTCGEWDSDGTCTRRLDWSEPRGINEKSQVIADGLVANGADMVGGGKVSCPNPEPYCVHALLYDPPIPDVDADGLDNDFEAGFGGNIKVNLETGDTATGTGSAEDGSTITSSYFSVEFPPGTKVADDAPQIEMNFGQGWGGYDWGYMAVISGADLAGGTKTVVMPFTDSSGEAVCIDDRVDADLYALEWCVGGQVPIPIPRNGEPPNTVGPYTVERVLTVPPSDLPRVRISGLSHTALVTITDTDLDGIPDWDDLCPTVPGIPEKQGCPSMAAPEVIITAPTSGFLAPVGAPVVFSGSFTDANTDDLEHTATWGIEDTLIHGTVTDNGGSGTVEDTIVFTAPGVYSLSLTVTDSDGLEGYADTVDGLPAFVVIYDPNGGFVTGGGWINSPPGAYWPLGASQPDSTLTGRATFGFVAKYQKGANVPSGQTEFQFKVANLDFHSSSYDWLVCGGPKCQFKGHGSINGVGNYAFLLSAIDGQVPGGGGADKLRMKIWDILTGQIIYDNQPGDGDYADPTTVIGGGSIVIHKG